MQLLGQWRPRKVDKLKFETVDEGKNLDLSAVLARNLINTPVDNMRVSYLCTAC